MISFLFGLVAVVLGLFGICYWHDDFVTFIKGVLPISLLAAGVVAIFMGLLGRKKGV